jgi:cell division protein FtsL
MSASLLGAFLDISREPLELDLAKIRRDKQTAIKNTCQRSLIDLTDRVDALYSKFQSGNFSTGQEWTSAVLDFTTIEAHLQSLESQIKKELKENQDLYCQVLQLKNKQAETKLRFRNFAFFQKQAQEREKQWIVLATAILINLIIFILYGQNML